MSDDNLEVPHRRFMDNLGNVKTLEVLMTLQSQEQELKIISKQVSRISAIEDVVNQLSYKVSAMPDLTAEVRLVTWHERLLKILGTVSIISIPALFGWAAALQSQVSDIRSDLKVANVRIEMLASKVSKEHSNIAPTAAVLSNKEFKF